MSMTPEAILLELLQGEEGASWAGERVGWDHDTDVCEWEGIKCDAENRVEEINIEGSQLIATLPESLSQMSSLKHLFLADNKLHGTLPVSIARDLFNLVQIDVSSNYLRGDIPKFLDDKLEVINLSHNQFSDKLPPTTGEGLSKVRIFDIENNRIGGTIPPSFAQMKELVELNLSNNKLGGSIPSSLNNLKKLEGLFLSNNRLIGSIPPWEYLPLKQIFMHGNKLSGTLPETLAGLSQLENLFIDNNKLTGTIPKPLCERNLNEMFYGGGVTKYSTITKDIDDAFGNADDLVDNDIYYDDVFDSGNRRLDELDLRDGCNSIACPVGYHSTIDGKEGIYPCAKCENDTINPYLGATACHGLDQGLILKKFYVATAGEGWAQGGGTWLDDTINVCDKVGITCNSEENIVGIDLSNMMLSGTVPDDLGFLQHLRFLNLSDNDLYGSLPSSLRFLPLEEFDISGNKFTGFVPPELCFKHGVNDNGMNGVLNCDIIACPVGTYSVNGRAMVGSDENACSQCGELEEAPFLGSKICFSRGSTEVMEDDTDSNTMAGLLGMGIFFLLASTLLLTFVIYQKLKQERTRQITNDIIDYEQDDDDNEFDHTWDQEFHVENTGPSSPPASQESSIASASIVKEDSLGSMGSETFPAMLGQTENMEWKVKKQEAKDIWLDVPKIHG